jgi:outer membrane protein
MIKAAEFRRTAATKYLHALWGQAFPTLGLYGSMSTNYSDAALVQKLVGVSDAFTDSYVIVNNTQLPVYAPQYQFSNEKVPFTSQLHNNLNSYLGFTLQVPVFNGLRTRTQMKIAKINKEQAEVQQTATNVRLKNNINQSYTDMNAAYERLLVLQDQVRNYSESFKIATAKFEKGAITTVDYVIAKNNIDRANTNLITARYDYILKSKVLDYYTGKGIN